MLCTAMPLSSLGVGGKFFVVWVENHNITTISNYFERLPGAGSTANFVWKRNCNCVSIKEAQNLGNYPLLSVSISPGMSR